MTRHKRKWDKYLARNNASHGSAGFNLMKCYPLPKTSVLAQRTQVHGAVYECSSVIDNDIEKQIQIADGFPFREHSYSLVIGVCTDPSLRGQECLLPLSWLFWGDASLHKIQKATRLLVSGHRSATEKPYLLGKASSAIALLKSG